MAEILAASTALGIASSLVTFGNVAWRIIKRLNKYNEKRAEVPGKLKHITAQLPLFIQKIEALKRSTDNGSLILPKLDLAVAIVACNQEITRINILSCKLLPLKNDLKF